MFCASYEFEHGYVRPIFRGVLLWNGSEGMGPGNQEKDFTDLVHEAIGADDVLGGYNLKGIKITIEIEEATEQ